MKTQEARPDIHYTKLHSLSDAQLRYALRLPRIIGWIYLLAALWSAISFFLMHLAPSRVFIAINLAFELINVPVSSNLFIAIVFTIASAITFLRKRIAIVIILAFQFVIVAAHVTSLAWVYFDFKHRFFPDSIAFLFVAISIFVAVTVAYYLAKYRYVFPGKISSKNIIPAVITLIVGLILDFGLGVILVFTRTEFSALSLDRQTEEFRWILATIFGRTLSGIFIPGNQLLHKPAWITFLLSFVSVLFVFAALAVFLRGRRFPARTQEQDFLLRRLLYQWGSEDSLGYYATRDNRCVVFSTDNKACISYGIAAGVALAAGDPIGDPASWDDAVHRWVTTCYTNGWIPAVEAASRQGALAYRRAGLRPRLMGDEAIVYPASFDPHARYAKPLMAAYKRVQRAGITIRMQRQSELTPSEIKEYRQAAIDFRVGDERGFSMALERMFGIEDPDILIVSARNVHGHVDCVLTFVPWGRDGVSLNLMRRNPDSINGLVEAMVVEMCLKGRDKGIRKISLNFAMLRHVFVEGEQVDAGLIDRLQRFILVQASRIWQLESLYESNQRYQPEWYPRYLCYAGDPFAVATLIATGMLEGFLPAPRFLVPPITPQWVATEHYVKQLEDEKMKTVEQALTYQLNDQQQARRIKAQKLREYGRDPFPAGIPLGEDMSVVVARLREASSAHSIRAHGRLVYRRNFGGVIFFSLVREGIAFQVIAERQYCDPHDFQALRYLDLGDVVVFEGVTALSRSGHPSVSMRTWDLLVKAYRPLPSYGTQLDSTTKVRQRTTSLLVDYSRVELLKRRSKAIATVREVLGHKGYLEVETPILQAVHGGANARPFSTYFNAYSTSVYMRIAPELYLKRLAVAGMGAVFELGRSFRNEGADATHNPEFTSLEVYKAGGDYTTMRELTEEMIRECARSLYGKAVIRRPAGSAGTEGLPVVETVDRVDMCELSIEEPWQVIDVYSAVSHAVGELVTPDTSEERLRQLCQTHNCEVPPGADDGAMITVLYDELVEAHTVMPTFYTDFPVATSPLTRKHRDDPRLAERWDLVAFGMELGTAYTELTDPADQRERFTAQSLAAAAGDPEAMSLDQDFLKDLELGLVPTGGLGIGMDRMVMLLTGSNIRQILAFPFVKPDERTS